MKPTEESVTNRKEPRLPVKYCWPLPVLPVSCIVGNQLGYVYLLETGQFPEPQHNFDPWFINLPDMKKELDPLGRKDSAPNNLDPLQHSAV